LEQIINGIKLMLVCHPSTFCGQWPLLCTWLQDEQPGFESQQGRSLFSINKPRLIMITVL